jgi:integrase
LVAGLGGRRPPPYIRDANLESRSARARIKPGSTRYRALEPALHLGYRRFKGGGSGTWLARFYSGDGRYTVQVLAPADDMAEVDGTILNYWQAQERARALHRERGKTEDGRALKPLTVEDAVKDYLDEHLEGRASHRDTQLRMAAYALPVFGHKHVSELKASEIARWHRNLVAAPPRARTGKGSAQRHRAINLKNPDAVRARRLSANKILGQLKAALNHAWREGKVPSDDAWRRVKPFRGVVSSRARYLTTDEARRLLNSSVGDFRLLLEAALQTGARYSELGRLVVGDFDRDAGTIAIRMSKSGKGRHVILTSEGQAFFEKLTAGRRSTELILRREWHPSQQLRPMKDACAQARIDPPISFHGLRHTYASLSVMGGVPLPILAQNLGHSTTRMCEVFYAHLAPSFARDAIRAGAPKFGTETPSKITPMRRR